MLFLFKGEIMSKQEFNDWIEDLKSQGYDEQEIEEIIENYLNQSNED